MLLTILFTSLLTQAPVCPPDSARTGTPTHGGGFILGAQLSNVGNPDFQLSAGPSVGFYQYRRLSDHLTFQIEFQGKIVHGYREFVVFEDNVVNPDGRSFSQAAFNLRSMFFFEIPLLLKYQRAPSSKHGFFVGVRPSANAITNKNRRTSGASVSNGVFPTIYNELSLRDAVRRYDLGLVGGWSYAFSPRFSLDVRYNQGLYDLTADNFFKNTSNLLNSDLQVSVRAKF